ncbi:MAG: hypothetical protein ACO3JL_03120, partial [Myxococcota bacterium]
ILDAAKATAAGAELTTRRETLEVVALEREVALEKGCGFFNLFDAMGGEGSLERFHRDGLINDDLVHPKGAGGDVLGNLIADALLEAYRTTPSPRDDVRVRRRLVRPPLYGLSFPRAAEGAGTPAEGKSEPLAPLFARLRELEQGRGTRLGVGLFGGLHVAGEVFPARIRERLQERFGDGGRGLLGVGPGSEALLRTGVQRALSGPVEWRDGRNVTVGGAMSLFGDAVRLAPEGRLDVRLCEDCQESRLASRGTLELTWLYTPDMGTADVVVNDVQVATLSPAGRRVDSDVQRLQVPVRGQQHTVSVQTRPVDDDGVGGPVHLFSLAVDMKRPGVVVDSVGIPGSTGMTMQRWRQDLLRDQVRAREYDVVVVAFGEAEVTLTHLDEVTYGHHLNATVTTLLGGAGGKSCVIVGPTDREIRGRPYAPIHDLIEQTQRQVAAAHGCAYFATRAAMGGQGSLARWRDEGLADKSGVTLTTEGYERLADLLLHDLLALYAYDTERLEQERLDAATLEVAKGQPSPMPAGTGDGSDDDDVKRRGRKG